MTVLATAPILTRIEDGMKELILGMREGAYNFTWGTVNQPDEGQQTFPSAEIMLREELNTDDQGGTDANSYSNEVIFEILIRHSLSEEETIPYYEINPLLNLALDDLKKLFGINDSVAVAGCDVVMYRGAERVVEPNGDAYRPKRLLTRWYVQYTQDRQTPTQNGD